MDLLLQKVKKVEVEFTHVAMGSLKLFSKYDPSYMEKMSKILTENVCELTKQDLPLEYYDKCVKDEQMNIITHGVINGIARFYLRENRECMNRIGKILLLPISLIKNACTQ